MLIEVVACGRVPDPCRLLRRISKPTTSLQVSNWILRLYWLGLILLTTRMNIVSLGSEPGSVVEAPISQFDSQRSGIARIEWLGNDSLAVRHETGQLSIWTEISKQPLRRRSANTGHSVPNGLLAQLNSDLILSSDDTANLLDYDLQPSRNELASHFKDRRCLCVSPNRRFCLVSELSDTDGNIIVLDCEKLTETSIDLSLGDHDAVAIDDKAERLVALKWSDRKCSLLAMNLLTNKRLWEEPNFAESAIDGWHATNLACFPDSDRFSVVRFSGSVFGGDLSIFSPVPKLIAELPVTTELVSATGRRLPVLAYAEHAQQTIALIDSEGKSLRKFKTPERVVCIAFSSDDSMLAAGMGSGGIVIYSAEHQVHPLPNPP